jgi:hypothetical protein
VRKSSRAARFVFLFALSVGASGAGAQHISPGAAVGIGIPTGDLGRERSPGPLVQAYLVVGRSDRVVRFQISAEGLWCSGRQPPTSLTSSAYGDLRALSILGTLLFAPPPMGIRPYLSLGGGLQSLTIEGRQNPYGRLVGVRSGAGIELPLRKAFVRAEISAHAVLSDFGTGHDFSIATYVPVTLSIQF